MTPDPIGSIELSVVVPAYNEALRIRPTLEALDAFLEGAVPASEIVVVDDGSTDGTAALVRGLGLERPRIRCEGYPDNRGKGHAVRAGLLAARGRLRAFSDADGSTSPDQLPALLEPLRRGEADVAIGSRYLAGAQIERAQPRWRRWWSRTANRVVQAALLPGILDTHCGFKAFTAEASEAIFARCSVDGWAFDLEVLALARALGLQIREVPVRWADDADSRGRAWHLLRATGDLWQIRRIYGSLRGRS